MTAKGIVTGWVAMLIALSIATGAGAQVFHMYPGAKPVPDDSPAAGATLGIGDDLLRFLGFLRFNVSPAADLGFELVLDQRQLASFDGNRLTSDEKWRIGAGGDFKYAFNPGGGDLPFDFAVMGGLGFQTGGDVTNVDLIGGGELSRDLQLNNNRRLVPYGGLFLVIQHVSRDLPPGFIGDTSDTDLELELRGGARLQLNDTADVFGALHVADETLVFFGLHLAL